MKRKLVFCAVTITVLAACLFEAQASNYNLTVQANTRTQSWNRFYEMGVATDHQYTLVTSYWNRSIGNALKVAHSEAGFKYWRGHAILDADVGLVTAATATTLTLNWTKFDSVYNTGIAAGMHPVVEISCTPPALASSASELNTGANYNGVSPNKSIPNKYGWGSWVALMDSIVVHCENKYGANEVRNNWYFEVWNEPDWWYHDFSPDYMTLFDYTVQGLKQGDSQVRVGGPACEGTNTSQIGTLLDHCYNGTNAATGTKGTKIDFVTYHWYADNAATGINGNVLNANNSAAAQKLVVNLLKSYPSFTGQIFEDEMGPSYDPIIQRDMQQSASWIAKTVHLLNEGGVGYPPPAMFAYWAISDIYEENMIKTSNLSFQEGNYGMLCRGTASYPNSWDMEKPIFQACRLLHKLGAFELSSSGGVSTSDGVNLVATCDSNNQAVQVLIYSHFASQSTNSAATDNITLTVNNMPWTGSARIETFLVDTTHSNTYTTWVGQGKPAAPSNTQWDAIRQASYLAHYDSVATTPLTGTTFTKTIPQLHYYSVMLVLLSNPVVPVKGSSEDRAKNSAPTLLNAEVSNGKIMLTLPGNGQFTVRLVSTNGRTIVSKRTNSEGINFISLAKVPTGTYLLECSGLSQKLVKTVMIGK
jgi:xylan 1,4-beta-xylosidase